MKPFVDHAHVQVWLVSNWIWAGYVERTYIASRFIDDRTGFQVEQVLPDPSLDFVETGIRDYSAICMAEARYQQ
jgi:hypothetical protein